MGQVMDRNLETPVRAWGDMWRWLGRQFWPHSAWDVAWSVAEVAMAAVLLALNVPVIRIFLAVAAAVAVHWFVGRLWLGCTDCDGCGRCARDDDGIRDRMRKSARVAALRAGGWTVGDGVDLCPACARGGDR